MDAFICDAIRTPIGRYGGALAKMRPDDLAAHVIKGLMDRHPLLDPSAIDEVIFGGGTKADAGTSNKISLSASQPVRTLSRP